MTKRQLVIRAVTLFAHLPHPQEATARLREIRDAGMQLRDLLQQAGFQVQTLRVALDGFTHWGRQLEPVVEATAHLLEALGPEFFVNLGVVSPEDPKGYAWLPELMRRFRVYASARLVAPGETRITGRAIWAAARLIRSLTAVGAKGEGNTRLAASAWVPPYTPFFPAAYADSQGPSSWTWALALETGGLLASAAFEGGPLDAVEARLRRGLEEETAAIAALLEQHHPEMWARFHGFDISWAPYPARERSVGAAMEALLGRLPGGHGTLALSAWLTGVLRRARIPRRTGFCGLMLPVLEDPYLARAVAEGLMDTRTLLLHSAVCGVGLDTVPLPGDVTEAQLASVLWDVAALAVRLRKPLAARIIPVPGYGPGDWVKWEENKFFTDTPVLPLPGTERGGLDEDVVLDLSEDGNSPSAVG